MNIQFNGMYPKRPPAPVDVPYPVGVADIEYPPDNPPIFEELDPIRQYCLPCQLPKEPAIVRMWGTP